MKTCASFSCILLQGLVYLSFVYGKIDSSEIFGHYSKDSKTTSTPTVSTNSTTTPELSSNNGKFSLFKLLFPSNKSSPTTTTSTPSRQEVPLTEFAISHPLISDSNARIPLYLYNPGLARKLGLSTLLMTSVIYGLTILPALLTVTGSLPFGGLFSGLSGGRKRKRRSNFLNNFWEMPLLDKESSEKFLSMLETTLEVRKVSSTICKKHHLCKVYQKALKSDESPMTLGTFERAIVNVFGLAAERRDMSIKLVPTVKQYSEAALVALTGSNCTKIYPCVEDIKYSRGQRYF